MIDEISMVRADVLDSVDEVLRRFRNHRLPFGGVQLLMIGDLHQLSPVVKDHEWAILRDYYKSVYFFDSQALQKSNLITIELTENFRQSDAGFIALLNKVRENEADAPVINELNTRFRAGFKPADNEGFITLTTHNALAADINQSRLKDIKKTAQFFNADVSQDFPAYLFPTDEKLELKTGAQVMFIKNDLSAEKNFYNGKIGKIVRMDNEGIFVKCPGDQDEIEVPRVKWDNTKYSINHDTKEIVEEVAGSFVQYPLRLAWAITIHKSQGLTFDKVIIDANAAFAFGQVYVALSRCRTFEGIVLSTPITQTGIKTDALVTQYNSENQQKEPGAAQLAESKFQYQKQLVFELFDFRNAMYRFDGLLRQVKEHAGSLDNSLIRDLQEKRELFENEIFTISEKFKMQMDKIMVAESLPEENEQLQRRIQQAITYFTAKIEIQLTGFIGKLSIETDNKTVRKTIADALERLEREAFIRLSCLKKCLDGYETIRYIRARSNADVDFRPSANLKDPAKGEKIKNMPNAELYNMLKDWRSDFAEEHNLPIYMVLPQKSLKEIVTKLPLTQEALKTIKGIGQARIRQYGVQMLSLIRDYCADHNLLPVQGELNVRVKREKS